MRIFLFFIAGSCWLSSARAQGPQGYWLSDDKTGFFEGLDNMEMRVDPDGATFSGSVYYIWEQGMNYQAVSLQGRVLSGDSIEMTEIALVSERNGKFATDCRGIFHLHYSRDSAREYLRGIWKKPPGSALRCPDTRVTFYRMTSRDSPWGPPKYVAGKKTSRVATPPPGAMPPSPIAAPPPNPDSLRLVAYKSRKDSVEQTIPHHSDTARIELYDDGIIDHDRISLFLGDSLILKNYELLAQAHVLHIALDKTRKDNVLSLYAENEGDIPPNTALMVIYIDDQRYDVRLSSDMMTNAKVIFTKLP